MLLGIRQFLRAAKSKFKMSDIRRHSIVLNLATHLLSLTSLAKRQSYLTPFDRPCVIAHYCSNEPQVTISITQRLRSQADRQIHHRLYRSPDCQRPVFAVRLVPSTRTSKKS
jgi:hypothetical protein